MDTREKFLLKKAIGFFMANAEDDDAGWEKGMDIISHLSGDRSERSKFLIKQLWASRFNIRRREK